MTTPTREQIVEAADQLFYTQGFAKTSFAHIAGQVAISRGNFYYHFKTKDQILDAVIDRRLQTTRTLLAAWEAECESAEARIGCFIRILMTNWSKIRLYGCPVGSLTTELGKLEHEAHGRATEVFQLFRDWLAAQFVALGCERDADKQAMHVLAFSQGVATVASAFQDDSFVEQQVSQMCAWVHEQIPAN